MKLRLPNKSYYSLYLLILLFVFAMQIPPARVVQSAPEIASVEKAPESVTYTVKSGDSLYRIANKYKVNLSQVEEWNSLNSHSLLKPGQTIVIKKVVYEPVVGLASWYGPGFDGQHMANTEVYDMYDIVVAHRTLPLGTKVRITNLDNGRTIVAPVLDRGPYVKNAQGEYTREIDLSLGVALALGTVAKGVVPALIEPINEPLPIN